MPYIPNSIMQSGKLAPMASSAAAPAAKPDVPRTSRPKPQRNPLQPERISIRKHQVDPERIFEQLFGFRPEVDEHTGVTTNLQATGHQGLGG